LLIEPGESGSIKIEQVRDVIDRAGYRPFEGRRRVVIVDEADALVIQAQNALLKILEEPPPSSVFILITARPDVLLPTVLSRCPQLRFRPLAADDIVAVLLARGVAERQARTVAATADGSLGRAIETTTAEDLLEARDLAHGVLAAAAGSTDPRRRIESAKDLLAKTGSGSGAADRDRLASHLRAMSSLLRDIEVLAVGGDPGVLVNADMRSSLDALADAYRGDRGVRAFAAVDKALVALERNAGVKIVADWVSLNL
jgi:DNA polymerase-3 subunit delta'